MAHTLCSMHRDACRRMGPMAALRFKRFGRYQDFSWNEYRRQADGAAAGLIELGIQPGDAVALLSENRHEWLVADHAILSAGAINVPLHAPLTPPQIAYQIGHSEAKGIIVSHRAQAEKLWQVLRELPRLKFLVSFERLEPRGDLCQASWQALLHRGWRAGQSAVEEIARRERALRGDDLATIIYTSGTTGNPKGVMLTHQNLLSNAMATAQVADLRLGDVQLTWLPFSHIYARTVDHYLSNLVGSTLALAESPETLVQNLAETRPTSMNSVPRFYEKIWARVESLPPEDRAAALRRIFGPRLRVLCSGGAPLPRHLAEGFAAAGIPLLEGYGLTESSPVISFNSIEHRRLGTVGRPIPGVEVRIAPDGEILTRGPHVMRGYWRDPQATAAAIVDGWLHTGDVGVIDPDGFLAITDRKKDIIVTSQGKNVSPAEIERLLVSDPWIDQAAVIGNDRPYVTAILVPNLPLVEAQAAQRGWSLEAPQGFFVSASLRAFFEQRVNALMQAVSAPERVKRFLLLARPFQLAEDELTATLKLRRRHVVSKFQAQIDALYRQPADREGELDA